MARAKREKPVIESIILKRMADEYPNLSWLGEYSDKNQDGDDIKRGSVIRRRVDSRRECRFFIPGQGSVPEIREDLQARGYSRGVAEEMARAHIRQNFKRMESYGDSWAMVGVQAEAVIKYRIRPGGGDWRLERLISGGLWGIESDSGEDHFAEVESEELADLREHLQRFGIRMNKKEWAKLTENAERKEV
jgi:hypothetical protein